MPEKNKLQKPPESFEKGLEELENLVDEIERGEMDLEDSLELFDRASYLSKYCMEFLKNAEKKIKVLLPDGDDFKLKDFDSEEGS
ncbi:MAG: exodeoxyribonuclease VII small subunit [Candidatus Zixiibacteriota bacterium]